MKTLILFGLGLLLGPLAWADNPYLSQFSSQEDDGIPIRVVKYADLLGTPGDTLRCFLDNQKQFGYLMSRDEAGGYWIDVISNGKLEGEKSRMKAVLKDYGSPFMIYLSVYKRQEDYGSYFELLLGKKWSTYANSFTGDAMFTEAYYDKADEKEHETLKPIFKKPLQCTPEKNPI